jgi:methylaspartate mutase sigma subunit
MTPWVSVLRSAGGSMRFAVPERECRVVDRVYSDTVILGVASSDAHVVANHMIAHMLREHGFEVVNLGVTTPLQEFGEAYRAHPGALAIAIGSLNGHAHSDLQSLPLVREVYGIACPVIVGGNLSVGSRKDEADAQRLLELGVALILSTPHELLAELQRLRREREAGRTAVSA